MSKKTVWTQEQIDTATHEAKIICDVLGIPLPYNTPLKQMAESGVHLVSVESPQTDLDSVSKERH